MDLRFTEEQEMMRKMVRDFARTEIPPWIPSMDREDRFPRELVRKIGELGLMGIPIPEKWGGAGADFISYILALEEISKVSAAAGVILAVHTSVGTFPILRYGTEAQKKKYVSRLSRGEYLGAFALTEPHAGSDASAIRTRAVRKKDRYILDGSKTLSPMPRLRIPISPSPSPIPIKVPKGSPHLLWRRTPLDSSSVKKRKRWDWGDPTPARLIFESAEIPVENRLGREGQGYEIALSNLAGGRIGIGAQALGIATSALEAAAAYAKERHQFGKPIGKLQAIQFKLADIATEVEAARLLIYRAANLYQEGRPCRKRVLDGQNVCLRYGDEGDHRSGPGVRRLWLHPGISGGTIV